VLRLKLKFKTFFFVCCWLPKYYENQVKMTEIISYGIFCFVLDEFIFTLRGAHSHLPWPR